MNKTVRPPAVAGMFYPGNPTALARQVDDFLAAAPQHSPDSPTPTALLVPHAGYVYSGSTAAFGYAQWRWASLKHIVVLGPTHRVGIEAIALPDADALATPLGEVPMWAEGASAVRQLPYVVVSARVHAEEHSLEVQLPFLQRLFGQGFDVLPLAVGWVGHQEVADAMETVWDSPDIGIVISSDLSHYHSYSQAQAIDRATLGQVMALDPSIDHNQACGATGLDAMLVQARRHGLRPSLLDARNSGDTAGDKNRVVGYGSVAFYPPAPDQGQTP